MKNNSRKIMLPIIFVITTLSLASCGSSESEEKSATYQISTDVSALQLEATIDQGGSVLHKTRQVITASFKGDGVIVGYAPGVEPPVWLDITTVSSDTNSTVFELIPLPSYINEPGEYATNVRFVTGKLDGSIIEYTSVKITLSVSEYFGIKLTESAFFSVADDSKEADLTENIVIKDKHTGLVTTDIYDYELVSSSASWLGLSQNSGNTSSQNLGPQVHIDKSMLLENGSGELYEAEIVIATINEKYGRKEHALNVKAFIPKPYIAIDDAVPNVLDFFINNADISISNNLLVSLSEYDRRVYITDINNFTTIGYYSMIGEPRGMSISPSGHYLYVVTYDNGSFNSYISVIDLSTGYMINKFEASGVNQYTTTDIVGNDNGEVFMGGHRYDAFIGELTGDFGGGDKAYALSSDQTSTYAISLGSSNPEVYHITPTLGESNTTLEVVSAEAPSYLGEKLWLDATNNILLTNWGYVFDADNLVYQSRIISDDQAIKDVAIDTINNKVFIAEWRFSRGSNNEKEIVYSYDLPNFDNEQIVTSDGDDIRYLFMVNGRVLFVEYFPELNNEFHLEMRYL